MRYARFWSLIVLGVFSVMMTACLEQYDPKRYKDEEHRQWKQSTQVAPKLSPTGELQAGGAKVVSAAEHFQTLCSGCHGPKGFGDGPAGVALTPKPRNFHDKAWQAKVDDAHIAKVITSGGASVGLSPMMAPWGAVLSPEEITAMVAHVRAFGKE